MSISEIMNNNTEYIKPALVMDDPQVAALVAAGHEDMALRISYELALIAKGTSEEIQRLEENSWRIPYDNYDGILGFVRFAWDDVTGVRAAREKAALEADQAYTNFVHGIETIRKHLDPSYVPMGVDRQLGCLFIMDPEWRLDDLREQADALLTPKKAAGPEAPVPAPR